MSDTNTNTNTNSDDSTVIAAAAASASTTSTSTGEEPESITINVDKSTLEVLRRKMEDKYNNFWGDVIDDEAKKTIEIADKLSPSQPYKINGKEYTYRNIGMKTWNELTKLKTKADKEKDITISNDLLTEYYMSMLKQSFGMTEQEADSVSPGEARMVIDAAIYKVLHPVPLHPEKLKSGSMLGER